MDAVQEKTRSQISAITRQYFKPFSVLHWHYSYEICQVLDNRMRFWANGQLVEAKAGDIVVFEENMLHQFIAAYGSTLVRIVQFSPKVLLDAGIPTRKCRAHISTEEIDKIPGLKQQLNVLCETIENEGTVTNGEDNYYQKCMVSALYCLLTRHFAEEKGSKAPSVVQKEILRILEYINAHYEEHINVKILAERLFMYRGRISTLFRKYSNMSMNEYVYSVRLKKANELLEQGNSIIEAALQSGFQNVRTFNRIYKKTLGITPSEYKNMVENAD